MNILSTIHKDDSFIIDGNIPICVDDFVRYMRGVDRHDQLLSYNPIPRKSAKYYKKLFWYIVDIIIVNCYVIYKHKVDENNNKVEKIDDDFKLIDSFHDFKLILATELIGVDSLKVVVNKNKHFIVRNLNEDGNIRKMKCFCCNQNGLRKETIYKCDVCNIPLDMECFKKYHS